MLGGRAGWRAGVFNRVPTLWNQLLPHLLADILQTFKPCIVFMDTLNMCMLFFGSVRIFFEKFPCSWTWSFFQHVLNKQHLLCVINFSRMFRLTFFKPCTVVMDTLKMCLWLFGSIQTFFEEFPCSWT
jgi:hypothetical protein